jgi:hypothetical protein
MRSEVGDAVFETGDVQEDGSLIVTVQYLLWAAHALATPGPTDLVNLPKSSRYVYIVLDDSLRGLESALRAEGFIVRLPPEGLKGDDALKECAQSAILTQNSQDFIHDAARCDYDVIAVEDIKFIDVKPDRANETVRKISGAIRRSQIDKRRGNFMLKVRDDGSFELEAL